MADTKTTIKVLMTARDNISGPMNKAGSSISNFAGNLSSLNSGLMSAAQPFADLADNILAAEAAVLALGAAFAGLSIAESIKYETALTDVKKVISDSDLARLDKYEEKLSAFSNKYAVSASEITSSFASIIQSGKTGNEAIGILEDVLTLVNTAELESTQAQAYISQILNGTESKAEESRRIADILNYSANKYATTAEQLAEGWFRVASGASAAGFTFEETNAILLPMIESLGSGAEAGTAFNSALTSIATGAGGKLDDILSKLGISKTDQNGLRDSRDILFDIIENLPKAGNKNEQGALLAALFGAEGNKLLKSFSDYNKLVAISNDLTQNAAGNAQSELATAMATTQKVVDRLTVSFGGLLRVSGDQFRQEFSDLAGSITSVITTLQGEVRDGAFEDLYDLIKTNFTALGGALDEVAQNLPKALEQVDFEGLAESFNTLFGSIENFFGLDADSTTVQGIAENIQFLADSLETLNIASSGVIDGIKPFFDVAVEGLKSLNSQDFDFKKTFGEIAGTAKSLATIGEKLDGLIGAMEGLGEALVALAAASGFKTGIGAALGGIGDGADGTDKKVGKAGKTLLKFAKLVPQVGAAYAGFEIGTLGAEKLNEEMPKASKAITDFYGHVLRFTGLQDKLYEYENKQDLEIIKENDIALMRKLNTEYGYNIKTTKELYRALNEIREENEKSKEAFEGTSQTLLEMAENGSGAAEAMKKVVESQKESNKEYAEMKNIRTGEVKVLEIVEKTYNKVNEAQKRQVNTLGKAKTNTVDLTNLSDELKFKLLQLGQERYFRKLQDDTNRLKNEMETLSEISTETGRNIRYAFDKRLEGIGDKDALNDLEDFQKKQIEYNEKATEKQFELVEESRKGLQVQQETSGELEGQLQSILGISGEYAELTKKFESGEITQGEMNKALAEMGLNIMKSKDAMGLFGAATDESKGKIDATKKSLTQIAQEQYVAIVKVNTERAKVEVDRVKAIFDGLTSAIESNLDSSAGVFNSLLEQDYSMFDRNQKLAREFIENNMKNANKMTYGMLDIVDSQRELIEAQADYYRVKGELGDIRIVADNLAPELQVVLKSFAENIRIQALKGTFLTD